MSEKFIAPFRRPRVDSAGLPSGFLHPLFPGDRPVFRGRESHYTLFYVPGYVCLSTADASARLEAALANLACQQPPPTVPVASDVATGWALLLWELAGKAQARSQEQLAGPFEPECLTLYLNNECPLRCVYCYSDPSPRPGERLSLDAILAAARLVAGRCQARRVPMTVVLHGGGEPTLEWKLVAAVLGLLPKLSGQYGIPVRSYIATNGVISAARARWLAGHVDQIGLSCDGPPAIQNRQRPTWNGQPTASIVERTGRILAEAGVPFHLRTTITADTVLRQAEIADYLCRQFQPGELHFEPSYSTTRAPDGLATQQATAFVHGFLEARRVAAAHGVRLSASGSRPGEIHSRHCHLFRNVLNLVPGGMATACFQLTAPSSVARRGADIGRLVSGPDQYEIDTARVRDLRQRLSQCPPECGNCHNRYHCTWGCPEVCPLSAAQSPAAGSMTLFRCQIAHALSLAFIREAADQLWQRREPSAQQIVGAPVRTDGAIQSATPAGASGAAADLDLSASKRVAAR